MTSQPSRPPWAWSLVYETALLAALPYALLHLLGKARRDRRYLHHLKERFGRQSAMMPRGAIWFHAVSVGELHAIIPLVEDCLAAAHPVMITGQTPAVRERVSSLWDGQVSFSYLPYDRRLWVSRFLDALQPRLAVFVERELWPNWFCLCGARHIPLLVINARLSDASLSGYRLIRPLLAKALQAATMIAARSTEDARLLQELGGTRIVVLGDLKQAACMGQALPHASKNRIWSLAGGRPFWVAGSTHEGEEASILTAHLALRQMHPNVFLILAPRHMERINRLRDLIRRFGLQEQRLGCLDQASLPAEVDVLLLDQLGVLASCYAGALAAFVGGTLVPVGGHTPFEAARAGCPVLLGPYRQHIAEAAANLIQRGAGFAVDEAKLGHTLQRLASDPALRQSMGQAARKMTSDEAILARYRLLLRSSMLQSSDSIV